MPTIHGTADSGNCYKPRLLMALTGHSFRHVEVSWRDGGTDEAAFLARNPIGNVPVLETDDGRFLPESNAVLFFLGERNTIVLFFLGERTASVPADRFERGRRC